MASILFYAPFNQRSRDNESLMLAFHKQGHRVLCLSQQEGFEINEFLISNGIDARSYVVTGKRSGWRYYLKHLFYFVWFCHKHRIDIVYSHLEPANFVASMGQYFIRAKTFLCRHHINEGRLYDFDKDLYYRITYRFSRKVIVVSNQAKQYMIEREGIAAKKIIHVNLAYDFSLYAMPNPQKVNAVRAQYKANVLLLSVCRLTRYKRPELSIETVKKLVDSGTDARLVILGKGDLKNHLEEAARNLGVEDRVFMPGYVANVLEFMAAADFLLHPSVLDSSCVTVKEAALVELPVIVCNGIGDFNDYIVHGYNGFITQPDTFSHEACEIIKSTMHSPGKRKESGRRLRHDVITRFAIENVLHRYNDLNRLK